MHKVVFGVATLLAASSSQAQTNEPFATIFSEGGRVGSVLPYYRPVPISTVPTRPPLMRPDPYLAQQFNNLLDSGDIQFERQYGPVGAGVGGLVGGFFGGSGYLMVHSVTDYQAATFQGFMMASLGGAFQGAIAGGSGSATVFFLSNAFGAAWGAGTAWIDSLHQTPDEVGGQ